MPRNPSRTTAKASWTEDQLVAAINSIKNGEKIRAVARKCGIHEATLRKRMKLGVIGGPAMGRKAVFNKKQEEEICSHLLLLAKLYYGVTLNELRRIAFEYADKNGIKNNFNHATKLAGKDWAQSFMKRNPQLSLRKPEATSINRILAFNKKEVELFFTNLRCVIDKYQFPPSRIFNVDETGITTVQKPPSIIGPKGQKQVGSATSLERGRNITICCAMSATGIYIPPMFIFPGVRASSGIRRGGPAGSVYHMSESGWMNNCLFLQWLQHFVANTQSSKECPTLLLMDNHSAHISLSIYNFCRDNGIMVVSFPPHTSHRLQPLDLTFFGPLKSAYNRECACFLRNNGFQRITKEDVPKLLKIAYEKVAGVSKAVSGFQKPGIFPFNDGVFNEEDFLPAATGTFNVNVDASAARDEGTSDCPSITEKPSCSFDDNTSQSKNPHVSISEISPIPRPSTSKQPRKFSRSKQHSEILTATPKKSVLEDLEKKTKKKIDKMPKGQLKLKSKIAKKAKKELFSDTSSIEDDVNIKDLCHFLYSYYIDFALLKSVSEISFDTKRTKTLW